MTPDEICNAALDEAARVAWDACAPIKSGDPRVGFAEYVSAQITALKRNPAPEKAAEGVDLERAKELCSHIPNTFAGNGNSLMELVFMAPALVAEVERLRKENGFYGMEVEADKSQIRRQIIELEQLQSANARMRTALLDVRAMFNCDGLGFAYPQMFDEINEALKET